LTEHGNVSSHVQAEKAAKATGVKPIYGLEAYTALDPQSQRKFHLTILAADATGYANLMRLVTKSWEQFYYWPTVTGDMLAEHNEGLIVLSGCSDSLLACSLLGGKTIDPKDASLDRARKQAARFQDLLGDRFYLETQMFPELDRTRQINEAYEEMASALGISLVATPDVHYPQPDDNEMQVILHAAGRGAGSVAAQEAGWEYNIRLTYPSSDRIAFDRMVGAGLSKDAAVSALRATAEIASRCNVALPKADRLRYPIPAGSSSLELIWQWLREGWSYRVKHGNRRLLQHKQEYADRTAYEMDAVRAKDFVDYFLMVSDIVRYAKSIGCAVGPARGSAAASLVCYLLRITEVDPLAYPLMLFERFIAPDRDDIPDIDLDFDDELRHLVREYAVSKYGADRVGNIANYVKYKGKNSLVDVQRVFPNIPRHEVETVKAMIIERSGGDSRADAALADTIDMFPAAKAVFDRHPDLWKATRLEGNYRGMSVHAAGLVIANEPIPNICALYTRERTINGAKVPVTVVSVDKKDADYLGLMKVDFLGLSTMGMIRIALDLAGLTLDDLYSIPTDDQETLDAFRRNDVIGIFQYEGRATRLVNREVKPDTFQELADINGLSRPGPLFSGTTADYIDIKHGRKRLEAVHPLWDRITNFTKGQVIYQEQVLQALKEIGQLPVTRVGEIRRIISQKLGEAQFNESRADFIDGAATVGVKADLADHMWGRLVTSATYSFNIAHCISYSMLGFWSMWLKQHHPHAFFTAQLRKSDKDSWTRLIKDAEARGISVRGVDPRYSKTNWAIRGEAIQAGWLQVDKIGPAIAARIEEAQPSTFAQLAEVKGVGPAILGNIERMDRNDPFGLGRVRKRLDAVRKGIESGELPLRTPTCTSDTILDAQPDSTVVWMGIVKLKEYKDFIEDERARTGDDIAEIKRRMRDPHLPTGCVLHCYDDGDEDVYVRVDRRVYPRFRRILESIQLDYHIIVAVARKSRNSFGASIYVKELYVIDPEG
jgi:DNA polymerase-3 subunit alpha